MFFFFLLFSSVYILSRRWCTTVSQYSSDELLDNFKQMTKWMCSLVFIYDRLQFSAIHRSLKIQFILHGFAMWLIQNPFTLRAMERKHSLDEFLLSLKPAINSTIFFYETKQKLNDDCVRMKYFFLFFVQNPSADSDPLRLYFSEFSCVLLLF